MLPVGPHQVRLRFKLALEVGFYFLGEELGHAVMNLTILPTQTVFVW